MSHIHDIVFQSLHGDYTNDNVTIENPDDLSELLGLHHNEDKGPPLRSSDNLKNCYSLSSVPKQLLEIQFQVIPLDVSLKAY